MSNQAPPPPADVYEGMEGYVGPTHWARPYFSNHHHENPSDMKMLGHVNCGYLSTAGRPPTLEALKQHAQSLAYLISTIAPGIMSGEVDSAHGDSAFLASFQKHSAYDWLEDLQKPYDNIDKAHRKPLNSLVNLVKRNSDEKGVEFHCPLSEVPIQFIEHDLEPIRPFQSHMTLLMHANECLERLDHEYSAMGGLLAILPTEEEDMSTNPDLPKARKTLIGQWLLFTQHLVARMHELEIAYANTLDLLANEAIVPAQQLSNTGSDGRTGREIVFPQDRWILANAGEDVFNFVHQMLDKREAVDVNEDNAFLKQNVVGDALRRERGEGEDPSAEGLLKGISYVDLSTRYYRLNGSGHGPIFCLPAFSDRPNTAYTKEMEKRPTVVTVPEPALPSSTTAWDNKKQELQEENKDMFNRLTKAQQESTNLEVLNRAQGEEVKRLRILNQIYEQNQGQDAASLSHRMAQAEAERDATRTQFEDNALELKKLRDELDTYKAKVGDEQKPPSGVVRKGRTFSMNTATFREYESRSQAVVAAKKEIGKSRATLQSLAEAGQLDLSTFDWLDTIADAA
ncbi:uncharacterized protein F4807DRAFT_451083 [Annulohypoxylon truncatum]|uniref:uncharacterized protein n=1 Tax=Annulohypoxylon truncatum TaxID=327061 RepID=UPI0020077276|nr:uncharacterized protein F4807DRAFT_451083 [Annulohypoxylon truncatum]KAI1210839.1 hypothetical protein F4807DRAFT_451083 [Annulohypoxylon truncatum]